MPLCSAVEGWHCCLDSEGEPNCKRCCSDSDCPLGEECTHVVFFFSFLKSWEHCNFCYNFSGCLDVPRVKKETVHQFLAL